MTPYPNRYRDPLPPPGSVYRLSCDQYEKKGGRPSSTPGLKTQGLLE